MRITVIITNHNYGNYIGAALDSVLLQTIKPKVVLVDDCSTDNSKDIYSKFKNKIELIITEEPGGAAKAKNIGIQYAWNKTDIFAFLDADDYYTKEYALEYFIEMFKLSSKVGLVYCDCEINGDYSVGIRKDDRPVEVCEDTVKKIRIFKEPFNMERFQENDIVGGNFAVSRQTLEKVGRFNEIMRIFENYELTKRITNSFIPIHIPESLVFVRRTPMSITSNVKEFELKYYWQLAHESQ